ncbi:MAG: hypothetical protein ACUVRF_00040 [Desulfotomaculales bacterium]
MGVVSVNGHGDIKVSWGEMRDHLRVIKRALYWLEAAVEARSVRDLEIQVARLEDELRWLRMSTDSLRAPGEVVRNAVAF